MTFQEESISAALEEAKPLLQEHWKESESHYGFPLDPDYDQYLAGYPNFYTITRYNHSTYYAMAVQELGQAIERRLKSETASLS